MRSADTPNSLCRSNTPARAASRITSSSSVIVWNDPLPSSLFTTRVTCLSSIALRNRAGTTSISSSPPRIRSRLASSNTRCVPGSPSAAPVITTAAADSRVPDPARSLVAISRFGGAKGVIPAPGGGPAASPMRSPVAPSASAATAVAAAPIPAA